MDVDFKVKGIDEINRAMEEMKQNLKRRSGRRIIKEALAPMLALAIARTPVRTGKMRESWNVKTGFDSEGQVQGYLRNKHFIALFVEHGHKLVTIQRNGTYKRGRWSGGRKKIVRGFVSGKRVLRTAFDSTKELAVDIAARELKKSLLASIKQRK